MGGHGMSIVHHVHLAIIRTGKSTLRILVDLIVVSGAVWLGWAVSPYLARLWLF
jgi:hypothetical protein